MSNGTFPVVEIFGPTIQGEGPQAGSLTTFVRFGGCDYRCAWCDSMYAVDPAQWKDAPRLGVDEIMEQLGDLGQAAVPWVTLSGGNPAMYVLDGLVDRLQAAGVKVAVETQGSVWRSWLSAVNALVISPKAPSSGMASLKHEGQLDRFIAQCYRKVGRDFCTAVKIVVFDDEDYEWAIRTMQRLPSRMWDMYLSVGTDPPRPFGEIWDGGPEAPLVATLPETLQDTQLGVLDRWAWLCEKVVADDVAGVLGVRVLPQLHVLAWGHARAV